jgi:hypothetical protein
MNLMMNCLHRSFAIFRSSLRSMPTLETIEEEVYESGVEPIGEPPDLWDTIEFDEKDWTHWQEAREEWGQWTDIEYIDVN